MHTLKSNPQRPWAIFLMGPTASGKTDLAVALRERYPLELISVDSALIYRGMDIGTAKPDAELLARAPHRLIDIRDPAESYSVAEFCDDARVAMDEITAAGRVPLLVGGTMMYFKALRQGLAALPASDPIVRQRLESEADTLGLESLHQRLQVIDPVAAAGFHFNNRQRLLRALEVYEISGKPISSFWASDSAFGEPSIGEGASAEGESVGWNRESFAGLPYNIISLAVSPADRSELHRRIELRFRMMLEAGFVGEVKALYGRSDLNPALPSIRAVGYRQVWDYLDGRSSFDEMIAKGIAATRQLAKRQMTWLRRWPGITWLESEDNQLLEKASALIQPALSDRSVKGR